jgi:general secretion pathway protein I
MGETEKRRNGETEKRPCWIDHLASEIQTQDARRKTRDARHPAPSSAGFTLLEVMVALSVLAIGIVAVLELLGGSLRLGTKATRHTQAALYAQQEMDRLFAQTTLEDGEESGELPGGYYWHARVQEIHPDDANTRLQPQRQSQTDFFHLKEIEVSVRWEEGEGQQSFALHSLRTLTEQPPQ